jgi:hypothetical protein
VPQAPPSALGVAGTDVAVRVERLLGRAADPRAHGRWAMVLGLAGLAVLAAVPVEVLVVALSPTFS